MLDERKISICIPTFNRSEMTIESFYDVYNSDKVSEIVIVDDCSDLDVYEDLKSMCDALPKVKLYRNLTNQDCYRNKMTAISYAINEWCILLDSDNKIDTPYIDRIFDLSWEEKCVYTPSFAKPVFDFRAYEGLTITRHNVAQYIDKPLFETMLNAANFFVNKKTYLDAWDKEANPVTSDSIFMSLNILERVGEIFVVPNLYYEHKVWDGSHYKNNVHRTPQGFHESILQTLRGMK